MLARAMLWGLLIVWTLVTITGFVLWLYWQIVRRGNNWQEVLPGQG